MATPRLLHTSLSNDSGITSVNVEVLGNILPQFFEDGSTSGEMKPSKEWVRNGLGDNLCRRARNKLNHTRRDTGLLQQLVHDVVRVGRGG